MSLTRERIQFLYTFIRPYRMRQDHRDQPLVTPVISTLTHGARDIFETATAGKHPCGLVVETEAQAMATAIQTLLDNPAKAQTLAANGETKASKLYKLRAVTETVVDIYKS